MELDALRSRFDAAGLDGAVLIENAAQPALEHARQQGHDPAAWLASVERYVTQVLSREGTSAWSSTHFVVPPLLAVAGGDAVVFGQLLEAAATALASTGAGGRLEQHGLRGAAHALLARPRPMLAVLEGATTLGRAGLEPGWFLQLVVPALATLDDEAFLPPWALLVEFAAFLRTRDLDAGYPIATGLAALAERRDARADVRSWLEVLRTLLPAAGREVYGLCEYGIAGLARGALDGRGVRDALELSLAMLDHGLSPGPTLQHLSGALELDVASRLAREGVDPLPVLQRGVAVFGALGWLDDGGEHLCALAIDVHRRGLRVPLLFDDGLDVLEVLEREDGGLARTGLELIEAMVQHDLEPGVVMRWSLPRTLAFTRDRAPWAAAETLRFARQLVDLGVSPEAAVSYAVRPMIELVGSVEGFRRLADTVVGLVGRLQGLGVDHREVLFHDVASLAQSGGQSQAFVELLERLAGLVEAWTRANLDLSPLLSRALPAAAREASGKPWVLAVALESATRLGASGRAAEALALLEVGLSTVAQTDAVSGSDELRAALDSLEARYAKLPPALTGPASVAACALAGTDVHRLDQALAVLVDAHARHGDALTRHATALPELAKLASTPDELGPLADALVRSQAPDALVALVATTCPRAPTDGARLLLELAPRLAHQPALAATVELARRLQRVASAASLPELLSRLHDGVAGVIERDLLVTLLQTARDEATLKDMVQTLGPLLRTPRSPLVDGLHRAANLLRRSPVAWSHLVQPALTTSKHHAGSLLATLAAFRAEQLEQPADLVVLRELITQRGMRTVDLLWNLVLPALGSGVMPSLSAHHALLTRYLAEVGFAAPVVYARFVAIVQERGVSEAEKRERVAGLRGEIDGLTRDVRAGSLSAEQLADPLLGVALQHIFPPSTSATQDQARALVERFEDRPGDVVALFGAQPAPATLEVAAGSWQLVPTAFDPAPFEWVHEALPTPQTPLEPLPTLGWELLSAWSEGRLGRASVRFEVTRKLLKHLPEEGWPSPTFDTAEQVLAIRRLAADQLMAQVEAAVLAARAEDAARVERLARARLAPMPRVGTGLVKGVLATLAAVRAGRLTPADATARLGGQLQAFESPVDVLEQLLAAPDVERSLRALPAKQVALEPGKELARVHAELVGQVVAQMSAVLARALEYRPSSDVLTLTATVTKRRAHAPIGFTEGVCVAVDEQLWRTPGFLHLALWLDGVCMGGVHLLVVEEGGLRALVLPGINPSSALLEQVEAEALLDALLRHVETLRVAAKLDAVWVPTSRGIHSNRHAIGTALEALALPVRRTAGHPFSYWPYAYRIDEVYVVTPRPPGS
jgi:hypothetical protein